MNYDPLQKLPLVLCDILINFSHFRAKLANGMAAYFFTVGVPLLSVEQPGR